MNVIELIARSLCAAAIDHGEGTIPFDEALTLVTSHLPDLLEVLEMGLVTEAEVAGAITDRFVVWLAHRSHRRFSGADPSWDLVLADIEASLKCLREETADKKKS